MGRMDVRELAVDKADLVEEAHRAHLKAKAELDSKLTEVLPARILAWFINICVTALNRLGVAPDTLTYLSLALAVASAVAVATGAFFTATALLIASGVCDLLDGPTARSSDRSTPFGALLDSTIDRVSDALPLAGMVFFYAGDRWFAVIPCLVIVATFSVSYIRARAESLGAKLPWLWMRRGERLVLIAAAMLLGNIVIAGIDIPAPLMLFGVGLIGLLSLFGALSAMRAAYAQLAR
jgi:CDP-diacylglycerol--glycerol-3-phosphate 3-phosphatidyltransferase